MESFHSSGAGGGIIGISSDVSIIRTHFSGNIENFYKNIGGIAGYIQRKGTISRSSASGTIDNISLRGGPERIGGIVGYTDLVSIIDCASGMDINLPAGYQGRSNLIGGLVGSMNSINTVGTKIENSYFSGKIKGTGSTRQVSIGSLVGKFGVPGIDLFSIQNSYVIKGNSPFEFIGEGMMLVDKDKKSGPITREQLMELVANKKVGPDTK